MKVPPWVKHDRLDDEVMVIDLESGAYFAFTQAAADAWALLAAGLDPAAAALRLGGRYEVAPATAATDVAHFAAELIAEGLLVEGDSSGDPQLAIPAARLPWTAPSTERFDDLADLLLLDPVHEVDASGWPAVREG